MPIETARPGFRDKVVRAGRTLVIAEASVSAVVADQRLCVAMVPQTNCRVKVSP